MVARHVFSGKNAGGPIHGERTEPPTVPSGRPLPDALEILPERLNEICSKWHSDGVPIDAGGRADFTTVEDKSPSQCAGAGRSEPRHDYEISFYELLFSRPWSVP
jgi:hypothetical protein